MNQIPADQGLLYEDLCAKLEHQNGQPQLIAYMGGVLGSLLRRKGDAAFLCTVQDAFTAGLAGLPWDKQVELAREVIGMVIAKRPEVASAWQRVSGEEPHPLARRAADASDDLPAITVPDHALLPPDSFEAFEAAVIEDLAGTLERRLALFTLPAPRFPSPAYCHDQPLFLANPAFAEVTRHFLGDVLLHLWREQLHQFWQSASAASASAALTAVRSDVWSLVSERLRALAHLSVSAEAKLEAARAAARTEPEFQLVQVPVNRKRVFSVLGVHFTLGNSVEMVTRKVANHGPDRPSPEEMLALDLATKLRDMAVAAGLDLPVAADLDMVRDLLVFDAEQLAHDLPALLTLVTGEAEHETVVAAIEAAVMGHPTFIADAVVVKLFFHGVDGSFGFEEMLRLAERWGEAKHPLLAFEVARRPRDLAFQLRDALRQRLDRNNLGLAVIMLCEVWRVLAARQRQSALDGAQTVFAAFPIAFAGDADEATFSEIGVTLAKSLATPGMDATNVVESVLRLYGQVVAATKNRWQ